MLFINNFNLFIFLLTIKRLSAAGNTSFNQPRFNTSDCWDANGITFATNDTIGIKPYGIFININNTIYGANGQKNNLKIWTNGSSNQTKSMTGNSSNPYSLFVTRTNDVYVNNDNSTGQVDKVSLNTSNSTLSMRVGQVCYGLFVDLNNMLYCSMRDLHQIIGKYLSVTSEVTTIIAGTGCAGSDSDMLNSPYGIFVTIGYSLYVADCGNDRIQAFSVNETNGTTVVGNSTLNCPTGITLDGDDSLFIVDSGNHRIMRGKSGVYDCIIGCSGSGSGSAANQLSTPGNMAFDSYGNIYVTDTDNNRIQKFIKKTACYETTEAPTTTGIPQIETTAEPYINVSNETCSFPSVTLIPGGSTISVPIQFRRSQDFYIISIINLKCNDTFTISTQWSIKNCTSNCSTQIQLDPAITLKSTELYIPGKTLAYGVYQLQLTVKMTKYPSLKSIVSVYVQITPTGITANLIQLGTSMITSGYEKDLTLNPGEYSIDPDSYVFNSQDWKYEYYCRIYGYSQFPKYMSSLLPIQNSTLDPINPSCLLNRTDNLTPWIFHDTVKSSITIRSKSLLPGRTYQFMVYLMNRRNASYQATGYLLVNVENTRPQLIVVGCVISTLCVLNMEFQLINPTTQVALYALCIGNCTNSRNITWNIYHGASNISSNYTQWTLFNQTNSNLNTWFFGINTSNFTAANKLFLSNPQWTLWRFEVVYTFPSEKSSSALNFVINEPPSNGSCSISPKNGTTSTVFDISCRNWFDDDGIKDYSLYTWTNNPSKRTLVSFSPISPFQVQLPSGDDVTSVLHIVIVIRDTADCAAESNASSVTVVADTAGINDLVTNIKNPTNNAFFQSLVGGNQNTIGQVLTGISKEFNKMNSENLDKAVSAGVPAASISISALGSKSSSSSSSASINTTAMNEYNKDLNTYANVREYLITFTKNLPIKTSNQIILQSLSLAQMTKSTNQLTRSTITTASDRCYQLAFALYSMASRIPYEDVQTAATQLMQCATNVLSAVNGPLQQRTTILNTDFTSATKIPDDYDTDVESDWSNLNFFADGNDFSWDTIQKGRNTYYQKQLASQVMNQANQIISLVTSALKIHINIGQDITMNTSEVYMAFETRSYQSLSNKVIQQVGNSQIQLPQSLNSNLTDNSPVSIRSTMEPLASFGSSKSQTNTNVSTTVSLTILDQNGNEVPIRASSANPIKIIIPRDPNLIISDMILQNVVSKNSTPHNQSFNLHYTNITSTFSMSVHIEIRSMNLSLGYLLIYKFDQIPILNSSIHQIDGWSLLCPSNLTNESLYTYFMNNQQTSGHQSVVIGLRELNSTELNSFCSNYSINSPPVADQRFNFTSNYHLRIYTSGCYYRDNNNNWKSDGLIVGPLTNRNETECFSTHLTTFAGGFMILPEPVNWNYVFSHADFSKNKTIYLTVICVSVIYLLLMIFSRYKDKKDIEKLGVTPLPDNRSSDQYFYQIIVFTGQRTNAGTKSNVHFVLSGDDDATEVRTFADSHRRIFQRGGVNAFIMSVPKSLGLLNCIRIWHDNSGSGSSSSWFLKYIIIRDLQTMEKFHFICQRWFAVEKDDAKIERVLPVAGQMEKSEFSYKLSKNAYHSVSDGHLWFSIFSRPPSNKFTRVQRCTCCFVLFYLSMFLNIMYYDVKQGAESNNSTTLGLSIGPINITTEQITIGIIVELLSLIPSLLIVQLFRRTRSRQTDMSPLRKALYEIRANLALLPQTSTDTPKKKAPKTLPWWFIFITYGLCVILFGLSVFFIIGRGIEFGDTKTQKWLISILSGFFSSILLTQPIKIICFAIFFAVFCRKSDDDIEASEHLDDHKIDLDNDEEYLHSTRNKSIFNYQPNARKNRLTEGEIAYARNRRLKEICMWSIIQEALTYLCFIVALMLITYANRPTDSYFQVDHLRNYFLNSRQVDLDYKQIKTVDDYWNWLEDSFTTNIRAQQWYNGDLPANLSGFINDKSNRLIGWITMRQLRIKTHLCDYDKFNLTCEEDYNLVTEETNSFELGWINQTTVKSNSSISKSFRYQTSDELDAYVTIGDHASYGGGGYVYEFRGRLSEIRSNLSDLHRLGWIDYLTRAVIIQLNLYNPNVELFTSGTLLTEFLSSGGLYPQSTFEPINFYGFTSLLQLIATLIYMIFIIYFMITEIKSFLRLKLKYFREFWSFIEIGIIVCSWLGVGIYIMRYREYQRISTLFQQTNGYVYINLQYSSYLNNILGFVYGFCSFFGIIKLTRLCRYNSRIYLFIKTLQFAGKELLSFGVMFSIVFMSFICLFHLLFLSKIFSCSTLLHTVQMLFEIMLMKFDAHELTDAASFLGPFCFSLFILIVVFVCMSMFLSIINESFRRARENMKENDEEIFSYMFLKFLRWLGLKKRTVTEIQEEQDAKMRSEYFDPIENFPDKMDQLLDALNRIYMTQTTELSRMEVNTTSVDSHRKKKE